MNKQLYFDLAARLQAEVPALKWIDLEWGQLAEDRPSVAYPCALIDIEYPNCTDEGEGWQQCAVRVTIRFAFAAAGQTAGVAPTLVQTRALEMWDVLDAAFSALQGWSTNEASAFGRRSQTTERRRDNLKVITQVWETTFEEEA